MVAARRKEPKIAKRYLPKQMIDYSINARVDEMMAEAEKLNDDDLLPGLFQIVADVIKKFEPEVRLEDLQEGKFWEPPYETPSGPGVYCLYDTMINGPWRPAIIYIGSAEHVKGRVRTHVRRQEMVFNGTRAVFIEHDRIRKLIEGKVIEYFQKPDSGHADTLLNKRR